VNSLPIEFAGKIPTTDGRCGNGVYHVGAPANLATPQAIEHLWEASHTEGTNGGALVISELLGVLVHATVKNSYTDVPAGSKLNMKTAAGFWMSYSAEVAEDPGADSSNRDNRSGPARRRSRSSRRAQTAKLTKLATKVQQELGDVTGVVNFLLAEILEGP
jgi:hypothetical protein